MKKSTGQMLSRIKSVYLFIKERKIVSTQEIVDEFRSTTRTIQRDLNVLVYNQLISSPKRGQWIPTAKKVKLT